jgi:hypothetical protein
MNSEPHAGSQAPDSDPSNSPRRHPHGKLWRRFIRYQLRKTHQHKAERKKRQAEEKPEERAARKTADATIWIAIFTIVLAVASILTLVEVIRGGQDTHTLAVAAGQLATAANTQSQQAIAQTGKMTESLTAMGIQTTAMQNAAKAAASQARTSRDALVSVQRAFITFSAIARERNQLLTGEHEWVTRSIFENSGATPAVSVIISANMNALPEEPNATVFKGAAPTNASTTIGPKAIQNGPYVGRPESFIFGSPLPSTYTLSAPPKPIPNLYVWGWVAYKDVFPGTKTHITEYCLHLSSVRLNPAMNDPLIWDWELCENHNCTDEYCKDYASIASSFPN